MTAGSSAHVPTETAAFDRKRLFIFDMDGTLLPDTTGLLAVAEVMGSVEQVRRLEERFALGEVSTVEFTRAVHQMWGQVAPETARRAFDSCRKLDGIAEVLQDIRRGGGVSCLITMSQDFFANHFLEYGFDHVVATPYPATVDAVVRAEDVLTPESKPLIARDLCARHGFAWERTVAFGDSGSDIPLFEQLDLTVAVNASERLVAISAVAYHGGSLRDAYFAALAAFAARH
ncbi:HAD family hydrolase [Streptoalloteichus tenebrarius]|nr:HAD-IB family phosphatase [Streptoalloteichus tenebrarius]